jgi:hypothetical protein
MLSRKSDIIDERCVPISTLTIAKNVKYLTSYVRVETGKKEKSNRTKNFKEKQPDDYISFKLNEYQQSTIWYNVLYIRDSFFDC